MASPFQQRSLQRKFIYFGLIVALFTGSLLFRRLVINPQATDLRLRQEDQGQVALTDTAMRLSLGGLAAFSATRAMSTNAPRLRGSTASEVSSMSSASSSLPADVKAFACR